MAFSKEGTWSLVRRETQALSHHSKLDLAEYITLHTNGEPLLSRAPHNLCLLYISLSNHSISILEW